MRKLRVNYINYGTGNRVNEDIYLNKKLKKYPKLHNAILLHEKKHTGGISIRDFMLDFKNKELQPVKKDWHKFLITHPSSWLNFLPVLKLGNRWTFDLGLIIIWLGLIFEVTLIWFLI